MCRLVGGSGEGVQEVLVADLIDREGGQSLIVSDIARDEVECGRSPSLSAHGFSDRFLPPLYGPVAVIWWTRGGGKLISEGQ